MKTFLIPATIFVLLSGCSSNNAFTNFNLTKKQEKSEDSILSAKILTKEETVGVVSALYLNRIMPKRYSDKEYFYISFYSKKQFENIEFLLNEHPALSQEELEAQNEFSSLISFDASWQKYYLISFEKSGEKLALKVKFDNFSSKKMIFRKSD